MSANNEPVQQTPQRIPHATLRYTTLRLGLFLVALVVMWGVAKLAGMDLSTDTNRLILLAVALLLSSSVSFFALSKYRDAMSAGLVARSQRLSRKIQDSASFEDEEQDA
ncbi:DUF4229 domain-containing protein [Actinospica sp. MGRD01-02]|uniref:DUF4229 domain-containing protein n=1 Tax=Actinospica acidithermotolerans TaxID=2828514 RepID=A0A941IGI1_9ACTN|nr:DUF4229 domain-containing protein [Actinospica acidithermotolerans]MBR7827430.1 DUF4229 domain-containing protein [Actinospica acidithermotolerans]